MKKYTLSFVAALAVCLTAFGQQKITKEQLSEQQQERSDSNVSTSSHKASRAEGALLWEEDFGGGFPAGWTINDVSGICPWVWSDDGSWGNFSDGGTTAAAAAINSTTGGNGFLICDPDSANHFTYGQPSGSTYQYLESYVTTSAIDLTGHSNVILEFQQEFRFNNSLSLLASVSNDGITWTDYEVQGNIGNNTTSAEPDTVRINISDVAGNQATVYLKFGWDARVYYWMIDDIRIYEASDNDLSLDQVYYNTSADTTRSQYYSIIPSRQARVDSLYFGALVSNIGIDAQTNAHLTVDVSGDGYFSSTSAGKTINPLDTATLDVADAFNVPSAMGDYQIKYTIEQDLSDDDKSNNAMTQSFSVSDTVYARDYGTPTSGIWYGSGSYYTVGNLFEFYETDTATSISIFIRSSNPVGAVISFDLYDFNTVNGDNIAAVVYSVKASDLGNWVTMPIGNVVLTPGEYVAGMKTYSDTVYFATNSNAPPSDPYTTYVERDGTWYYTDRMYYIRLNTKADPCLALTAAVTQQNVSCNGFSDGSLTVLPAGGSTPYTYNWDDGSTSASRTNLPEGIYSVDITEAGGCELNMTYKIEEPEVVASDSIVTVDVTCGETNGEATLYMSGGTTPYTYLWSNNNLGQSQSGLATGVYDVTVEDAMGCVGMESITITGQEQVEVTTSIALASCGGSDGSVTLTPATANTPYTYVWQSGNTTTTATGMTAGEYMVTITDNNSCEDVITVLLDNAGAPVITHTVTDVACNGDNNASIEVTLSGGTTPYNYEWIELTQTTQNVSALSAGTYTLRVVDGGAPACQAAMAIQVTEPTQLMVNTLGTNTTCASHSDGEIELFVSGGVTPYGYTWNHGATTQTAAMIAAATYIATITDANGCSTTTTETIDAAVVSASISSEDVSCYAGNDGTVYVWNLSGGAAPYTYLWSDGQVASEAVGLVAGTYSVTISDKNLCSVTLSDVVGEPTAITITGVVTDELLGSPWEGDIDVTVSGGTPFYTYSWSGPNSFAAATADISGLETQGNYVLGVTDNNGCTATETFVVAGNVSVEELNNMDVLVYPNPAEHTLQIVVASKVMLHIYDITGKVVVNNILVAGNNTLDVSALVPGSYFVNLTDDKHTHTEPLIIK